MLKISVIIPVFNVESYIVECLESLEKQTYQNLECLLIDDKSTDDSNLIISNWVEKYDGKIEFILHSFNINQGLSGVRNFGIKESTGDYLFFLDSDDTITPDCFSSFIEKTAEHTDVDLVQGELICDDPLLFNNLSILKKNVPDYCNNQKLITRILFIEFPVVAWNKLIKRSIIVDNNLFFKEGLIHEDVYWLYCLRNHINSFAISHTPTYIYRYNPNSIMASDKNEKKRVTSYLKILDYLVDEINTSNKYWDSYGILRQFEHCKRLRIFHDENRAIFDINFTKSLNRALESKNILLLSKPLFRWLKVSYGLFNKTYFLYKKNIGLLYRYGKFLNSKI